MRQLRAFAAGCADFVIGDDWQVAALVLAGLALTALLTHVAGVNAWWVLPVFALAALGWSLYRAAAAPPPAPARPQSPHAATPPDTSE